jgi:hypothetical protein
MQECTELFLHYREIARLIWNLGFRSNPKLGDWNSIDAYRNVIARLFEGMILPALGYQGRIEHDDSPGELADFRVKPKRGEMEMLVDKNLPGDPDHIWGHPVMRLGSGSESYQLKFMRFLDWDELGIRDFKFLEVLIQRLDEKPDLVGHHALLEVEYCSIWFVDDDEQSVTGSAKSEG